MSSGRSVGYTEVGRKRRSKENEPVIRIETASLTTTRLRDSREATSARRALNGQLDSFRMPRLGARLETSL